MPELPETRLQRMRNWRRRASEILYDKRMVSDCSCPELCKSCIRKLRFILDSLEREGQGRDILANHLE